MNSSPTAPLSAARGTQPSFTSEPISPSGSLPIRAPLSSDDTDTHIASEGGSDAETLTSADDGFETASDLGEATPDPAAARRVGMPIAQLTGDDDDPIEGEVFEDVLADEADEDGFSAVARVPSADQDLSLVDEGEVLDGEMDDPSPETGVLAAAGGAARPESPIEVSGENPNPVEDSQGGVLGAGEKGSVVDVHEIPLEIPTTNEAVGTKPADSMVSALGGVVENGVSDAQDEKDEHLGGGSEEAGSPVVQGLLDSKPVEAESDDVEVKKDGATDTSGSDEKLGGAEESKHEEAEVDAGEVEKTGAADGADSHQNLEPVSVPAAESLELESSESNVCVSGAEIDGDLNGASVAMDSELADSSVGKPDGGSGDEAIAGLEGSQKDGFFDGGSSSVDPVIAEDSAYKIDVVLDSEAIDRTTSLSEEIGDKKVMTEPEQASIDLEVEPNVPRPESAADGGDSISVQEVESQPIIAEGSKSREAEREILQVLGVTEDGNSELTADGGDSISVQEAESQPIIAEGSKSREAEREILEVSGVTEDGNAGVISGENLSSNSVSSLEEKVVADVPHVADDDEKIDPNVAEEEEEGLVSSGPARVAILESSETAKQIIKDLEEGSSSNSTHSGFGSLQDYSHNIDGQIASDSDEEMLDTDEEGDGKELFDSAALAALLKAATGASPDGSITFASPDATRIFNVDRPAGLGSSVPSLKPASSRSTRPNLFTPSDLAVAGEPENNMDEEERKLHDKVELIRVKFLRLVHRLGHSPEDTVAAQVLYRLGLAEGIRHGRQTSRAFSLENAKKKALELEMDGKDDLDFSCNILVLGKTGVGKSATINSIFGEEKSQINAFERATASVKEIVGIVDGVKIRVIDTPGLRASVMDQASNKRILSSIKKYTKKCPPDIVLYVDRMDTQTRDFNDLPLLRSITSALGSSIWFNAIVALTHAASAPPDGPNGYPLSYDVFVAQRSHVVQHSIRQAAGDMRLMNPVALVENHLSCRRNREGERVLPNGQSWRPQMLLLCYSSKILSEANSLLKLQDPSPGKLFGFRLRSPPLPFLLSSLLQSRSHPKLSSDQGGEDGDSDVDLDDLSDADQEEEEDEYDDLPPFKPLRKSQLAKLTKEQRRAYFDEYDYRVKLLQKKQWKEELRRLKEMKKRGKGSQDDFGYGDMAEDFDQDNVPAAVPVPLPDMALPPSFDCDYPAYRYRFLEPTSQLLIRPVLDSHGWDHDCGYDGVSLEQNLAVVGRFPAGVSVQVTKDKKEFNIHLDSSISAKHGENGSTLAGFDIQSIGKQLAYILRSETKFKNLKKNKTAAGISITFLGETVATGLKIEDQVSIGKRVSLVASTGAVRAQGDMAYGANLEARLRDKDYPIGQSLSTLGLSLMRWRGDLILGANLLTQFSVGRNSKMAVRVGLNNKLSGQITVRTSSSEHLQLALVGILPIAISIYRSIWPGESIPY